MCTSVAFRGHIYQTPRDLGKLVGLDRVVWNSGYKVSECWDSCTCCVNIPKTFQSMGFSCVRDEDGDPMRYIVDRELSVNEAKRMRKRGVEI